MKLSHWIVSRLVPDYGGPEDSGGRARIGLLEGWTSVAVNVGLFIAKGLLGLLTGSVSLLADAMHTLSDCVTSVVVIVGFRISRKPPDQEHPFGHGRMESIAGVIIAVLLGVVAVEMFQASVRRILQPRPIQAEWWIVGVLAATLIIKELLARFSYDLADLIGSETLRADGAHHRSDVLSTVLVIAAFVGARLDVAWLDGAMGIGVSIIIAWATVETMRGAMGPLLGQRAPEAMYDEIDGIARSVDGVDGVHDVLVQRYGAVHVISLHIEVPASEAPLRLHEMSEEIEAQLVRRFPGYAMVHIDPLNRDHEHYGAVCRIVSEALDGESAITTFHDLRLLGGSDRFRVVFDVSTRPAPERMDRDEVLKKVSGAIHASFPLARVTVNVDPPYLQTRTESPPPAPPPTGT